MFEVLQVLSLLVVALAMALALADALEMPGKMRLSRDAYLTVQPICYPRIHYRGWDWRSWGYDSDLGPAFAYALENLGIMAGAGSFSGPGRYAGSLLDSNASREPIWAARPSPEFIWFSLFLYCIGAGCSS